MAAQDSTRSSHAPRGGLDSLEVLLATMPLGIVAVIAVARQDIQEEAKIPTDHRVHELETSRPKASRPQPVESTVTRKRQHPEQ